MNVCYAWIIFAIFIIIIYGFTISSDIGIYASIIIASVWAAASKILSSFNL